MSPVTAETHSEWSARLADALVQSGYETTAHLAPLQDEARASGESLATLLIRRQLSPPGVVVGALAQLAGLAAVDVAAVVPSPDAEASIPVDVAREFGVRPLRFDGPVLTVAFAEPPSPDDQQMLEARIGYRITPVLGDPVVIEKQLRALGEAPSNKLTDVSPTAHSMLEQGIKVNVDNAGTPLHVDDLLRYAVAVGASDLHLTSQQPASIRLHGAIRPIEGCPVLSNDVVREMIFGILPAAQRERFEAERELDTSHSIAGVGRFRVNVSLQRGSVAAALRPIPHKMPEFDTLGIPESVKAFTDLRRGLVLVTGPTGSGKSTTLASLIDIINRTKPLHIVTSEDPIEFLHDHKRSVVSQREIGEDTFSFAEALRRVLRQDPDVILVGELRDLETISTALTAAETGHLVFATLHTQDAPQTIDRIIDVFPTNQQEQIRVMLAATLEGVVTQQLIPTADGTGRVPCSEVLVCTSGVRNLIRQAKTHQIYSLMQVGAAMGMQTMDQGLARLVRDGLITEAIAYDRSSNEEDLRNHLHA